MAFNGSGTFSRLYSWVADAAAAIKISSVRMDAEMDGMATGLSTCLTKDGQTTPTANLPMGTYRHTGVGDSTALTSYPSTKQVQNGALTYDATDAGSANAYAAALPVTITAYTAGLDVFLKIANTNTGASTLNVDGLGVKNIKTQAGTDPGAGAILAGQIAHFKYDGTNFILMTNSTTQPHLVLIEAGAAADNKRWDMIAASEALSIRAVDDAVSVATSIVTVQRTGTTVDSVTIGGSTVAVTNALTVGGSAVLTGSEGTWTPSLGGTATYTSRSGKYVRVGNLVYVECEMTVNVIGTGATATISGLPFTSAGILNSPGCVDTWGSVVTAAYSIGVHVNSSSLIFQLISAATATTSTVAVFGNGTSIKASAVYITS